ncbi:hypothetical protein JTB14_020972 [Gonioctena quinquepunctata]|nr:hypothetical protein JTB14_020972 [Gonioctena quinquepunctata]
MASKFIDLLPNTYTFAKSLAEHVVNDMCRGKFKTVIIRPSVGRADGERTNSSTDGEFDMTNQEENGDNSDVRGDVSSDEDSESANFLLKARPPPTI